MFSRVLGKLPPGRLLPGRLPPILTLTQTLTLTQGEICCGGEGGGSNLLRASLTGGKCSGGVLLEHLYSIINNLISNQYLVFLNSAMETPAQFMKSLHS